jgi:ankyrin repeat protein
VRWFHLEAGSSITHVDLLGLRPIHLAARVGHLGVVQYLKEAGECPYVKDAHSLTPLYHAATLGHVDVVRYLASQTVVDVNARDETDRAAIHLAASQNRAAVVKVLVEEFGADRGGTVLNETARSNAVLAAGQLVKYGAKLVTWAQDRRTASDIAKGDKYFDLAEELD